MPQSERQFIFMDETGDPGHTDRRDASRYYQLNLLAVDRTLLGKISSEFSRFRYFAGAGKELERYVGKYRRVFTDLIYVLAQSGAFFYSFCLNKEQYVGPYLRTIGRDKYDYNPRLFSNFIIRKSLETFFQEHPAQEGREIELVFDRFLANENDEKNLKEYLRGNYRLPPFLHIVQVDSMYSDAVQVVDIFGSLVKHCVFDEQLAIEHLRFCRIFHLEDPSRIQRKNPDTH
jgi:hypothetical protein